MIFYYVPEDKDELSTPNAFLMQCALADITLDKIERQFPLPGDFIFRFKYSHSGQNVWLDLSNKKCPVPKYDNKIIIKATRKVAKYTVPTAPIGSGLATDSSNVPLKSPAGAGGAPQANPFMAQSKESVPSMNLLDF